MSDTVFSDFWIQDRGSPAGGAATRAEVKALAASLARLAAELEAQAETVAEITSQSEGVNDTLSLAGAVADVIAGRSVVLRISGHPDAVHRDAAKTLLEQLIRVTGRLDETRQEAAIARLAEVILPDDLAAARGTLAADNLAARDRFVAETAPFSSVQVAEQAGYRGGNPYATAARWKKAGDIFSVQHRGNEYFPTFQFRDGRPHPAVRRVLTALPSAMSPWQRAFWFVSSNGWLDNRPPAARLDDTAALIAAAEREGQEVIG